jgi:hypothetical protein
MPEDIRGWLADAIGRRTHRPALEQTLFHQLDALEKGPLEQLGELVRAVVDELRLAQQRLNEQAADLRALRATVVALNARVDGVEARVPEPEAEEPPAPDGHVLLVPSPDGYRLVERGGPPPAPGEPVEHDGRRYGALSRGRSPFPGDARPCLLVLP